MKAALVAALAAALVASCAAPKPAPPPPPLVVRDTIVLLPSASGENGSVVVKTRSGQKILSQPYEAAEVTAEGGISTRVLDQNQVNQRFSTSLEARSPRPVSFTLYFREATVELTAESRAALDKVKATLTGWPAPEISVIGHTDTVGSSVLNDELSFQRAEAVKKMLMDLGIEASRIEAVGRGERELLVPTKDEVAEPRNRRVEVSVR